MPKQTYVPTEADRLTGQNVRRLRRLAGETLQQTLDRSGVGISQSSLSNVELGKRQLTLPEATKLAAHFHTTAERIIARPQQPVTEQEWLGNDKPALRAVPDTAGMLSDVLQDALGKPLVETGRTITIHRDNPLTPDEYREQVWIPYLEQRYAQELKQTG